MRKVRVVFTTVGAVPALAVALLPAIQGCGSDVLVPSAFPEASVDGDVDASDDVDLLPSPDASFDVVTVPDAGKSICGNWGESSYLVEIPPPGVVADPGQICAVSQPPVTSNTAARITLTSYSVANQTATGFIAVPPVVGNAIVGTPSITVMSPTQPALSSLVVTNLTPIPGGYLFAAKFTAPINHGTFNRMTLKATFAITCGDAATQTVESITKVDMCVDGDTYEWVSSGDACTVCAVIAEMAPSPIPSDNQGDDLPLGRVIRIRVIEVARAGRQVLLLAENDGGDETEYEWHVSGGALTPLDRDLVLWSMPDEGMSDPFGQVAVWNAEGAVVENFLFGAA